MLGSHTTCAAPWFMQDSMAMVRPDPNPPMSLVDARALAEKRRAKAMFDAEWERQGTLLARPYSFTLRVLESEDVRLQVSGSGARCESKVTCRVTHWSVKQQQNS